VSLLNTELSGPCASNPCENNGKCIPKKSKDGKLTYECKCRKGFKGVHCEHGNAMTDVNISYSLLVGPCLLCQMVKYL